MVPKSERLKLFIKGLVNAEGVCSHDEAFALMTSTLNDIEDVYSGVTANPAAWQSDGRMYPPQPDMAKPSSLFQGVTVYRNRGHRTLIDSNGAFRIEALDGTVLIEKANKEGLPGEWARKEH